MSRQDDFESGLASFIKCNSPMLVLIVVFAICASFAVAYRDIIRLNEPKYGDRVTLKDGFYAGRSGVVIEQHPFGRSYAYRYVILLDDGGKTHSVCSSDFKMIVGSQGN